MTFVTRGRGAGGTAVRPHPATQAGRRPPGVTGPRSSPLRAGVPRLLPAAEIHRARNERVISQRTSPRPPSPRRRSASLRLASPSKARRNSRRPLSRKAPHPSGTAQRHSRGAQAPHRPRLGRRHQGVGAPASRPASPRKARRNSRRPLSTMAPDLSGVAQRHSCGAQAPHRPRLGRRHQGVGAPASGWHRRAKRGETPVARSPRWRQISAAWRSVTRAALSAMPSSSMPPSPRRRSASLRLASPSKARRNSRRPLSTMAPGLSGVAQRHSCGA